MKDFSSIYPLRTQVKVLQYGNRWKWRLLDLYGVYIDSGDGCLTQKEARNGAQVRRTAFLKEQRRLRVQAQEVHTLALVASPPPINKRFVIQSTTLVPR